MCKCSSKTEFDNVFILSWYTRITPCFRRMNCQREPSHQWCEILSCDICNICDSPTLLGDCRWLEVDKAKWQPLCKDSDGVVSSHGVAVDDLLSSLVFLQSNYKIPTRWVTYAAPWSWHQPRPGFLGVKVEGTCLIFLSQLEKSQLLL